MLADTIARNRLGGLQGLASLYGTSGNLGLGYRGQDLSSILGSGDLNLRGLQGMTGLYSATPGMANMLGNQMLESGAQGINLAALQNQLANSRFNAQLGAAQVPSNFGQALGYTGQLLGLGGQMAGAFSGIPWFGGGGSNLPSGYGVGGYDYGMPPEWFGR